MEVLFRRNVVKTQRQLHGTPFDATTPQQQQQQQQQSGQANGEDEGAGQQPAAPADGGLKSNGSGRQSSGGGSLHSNVYGYSNGGLTFTAWKGAALDAGSGSSGGGGCGIPGPASMFRG